MNSYKHQSLVARFRAGNEEKENKYWAEKENRKCNICYQNEDTPEKRLQGRFKKCSNTNTT